MSQPTMTILTINPGQAAWDATINDQIEILRDWLIDGPLPIWANTGAAPVPSDWDQSIFFQKVGSEWWPQFSDGVALKTFAWSETFVATLGQVISNPPTQTEVQDLSDKVDEIILALRDGHALPSS